MEMGVYEDIAISATYDPADRNFAINTLLLNIGSDTVSGRHSKLARLVAILKLAKPPRSTSVYNILLNHQFTHEFFSELLRSESPSGIKLSECLETLLFTTTEGQREQTLKAIEEIYKEVILSPIDIKKNIKILDLQLKKKEITKQEYDRLKKSTCIVVTEKEEYRKNKKNYKKIISNTKFIKKIFSDYTSGYISKTTHDYLIIDRISTENSIGEKRSLVNSMINKVDSSLLPVKTSKQDKIIFDLLNGEMDIKFYIEKYGFRRVISIYSKLIAPDSWYWGSVSTNLHKLETKQLIHVPIKTLRKENVVTKKQMYDLKLYVNKKSKDNKYIIDKLEEEFEGSYQELIRLAGNI